MMTGGDGGIRTLDRALQPYNGLANRRLQPLGHVSRAERRAATYARRLPPLQAPSARAWRALLEPGFARPSDDRFWRRTQTTSSAASRRPSVQERRKAKIKPGN